MRIASLIAPEIREQLFTVVSDSAVTVSRRGVFVPKAQPVVTPEFQRELRAEGKFARITVTGQVEVLDLPGKEEAISQTQKESPMMGLLIKKGLARRVRPTQQEITRVKETVEAFKSRQYIMKKAIEAVSQVLVDAFIGGVQVIIKRKENAGWDGNCYRDHNGIRILAH